MKTIIGLDFGNVIKLSGETEPLPDAKETITQLAEKYPVYIISRVDDMTHSKKVESFLIKKGFYRIIDPTNIYFCIKRDEKAPIAHRLKITHFIDDRTEVLSHMTDVPNKIVLNPTKEQLELFPATGMTVVKNWADIKQVFQLV